MAEKERANPADKTPVKAGGCKSGDQGCKGKNTCKGKGGCATEQLWHEEAQKAT